MVIKPENTILLPRRLLCAVVFYWFFAPMLFSQNSPYRSGIEFTTCYLEPHKNRLLNGYPVGAPTPYDSIVYSRLYIAGSNEACVKIEIPVLNFKTILLVEKDSVKLIELPYNPVFPFGQSTSNAIFITSNNPVSIYQGTNIGRGISSQANFESNLVRMTEGTALIPDAQIDSVPTFCNASIFWINLLKHTTGIDFYLIARKVTDVQILNSTPIVMSLPFSTIPTGTNPIINLQTSNVFQALSGTGNPYSFEFFNHTKFKPMDEDYSSFKLIILPFDNRITSGGTGATVFEDTKPYGHHSYSFHSVPIMHLGSNIYSIFALEDSTEVWVNGAPAFQLNSNDRKDTLITGPTHIYAQKPLMGYIATIPDTLYGMINQNRQSPFSVSMNGDNELIKESLFATMDEPDSANNYIIGVVTKTNAVQALRINGQAVNTALFTAFATDPAWSWANIPINPGVYKVQSDSGFQGIHYTYYNNPLQPAHYIFPSYGFVLAESVVWSEDSSFFEAGLSMQDLIPFAAFNSPICAGELVFFQPNHTRYTTWLWSFGDGTTFTQRAGNTRAPAISHTFANPGQYWVTVTDSAGCAQPDSVLIVVEPNPIADFAAEAQLSCEGYYISLQNQSNGATSYNWQWPGGNSTAENPNFIYTGSSTQIPVTLIASSGNCTDTLTQNIELETSNLEQLKLPNIITPNNDGVNDALCFADVEGFAECFNLQIFNRWGGQVYQTRNPQDCWPATGMAGGVYFYVLNLGETKLQGSVTVMR